MLAASSSIPFFFFLLCTVALLPPLVQSQACDTNGRCDKHEMCPKWTEAGECTEHKSYMSKHCPVSCGLKSQRSQEYQLCRDHTERCKVWAELGECEKNAQNMHDYCAASCGLCLANAKKKPKTSSTNAAAVADDPNCKDQHENCSFWAEKGECQANETYMSQYCTRACDLCKPPADPNDQLTIEARKLVAQSKQYGTEQQVAGKGVDKTMETIRQFIAYVSSPEFTDLPAKVQKNCQNRHELCAFWASINECEENAAYMATNCAIACRSCAMVDFKTRCPILDNAVPALTPGGLNFMFERILKFAPGNRTLTDTERHELHENNMTEFTVNVHSRPAPGTADKEISVATDKSEPVWVITMDNFLTPYECETMIELGHKYVYKRSEDVGAERFDGSHESVKSSRRTSDNAWCSSKEGCRNETIPTLIHERMAEVMKIAPENSEDLQLLKYEKGAFYRTHHDYIPHQKDRQCGPRILTFFLYLSDVPAGGGTDFPSLGITVMPKQGRALLWPSVLNAEPIEKDGRTQHQALDVEEGVKFAANGWIHMYDYVTPQKKGCT